MPGETAPTTSTDEIFDDIVASLDEELGKTALMPVTAFEALAERLPIVTGPKPEVSVTSVWQSTSIPNGSPRMDDN